MAMISISKTIGIISSSFVLSLVLSHAAQADSAPPAPENMTAEQNEQGQGGGEQQVTDKPDSDFAQGQMISGQVLRVDGDTWFVKEDNGKEVQLHIDETTNRFRIGEVGNVEGTHIDALVNDENHVLSIQSPDRRNDRHLYPSDDNAGVTAK